MNLGQMRTAIFAQADWGPRASTEAKSRANEFINRAYNLLALEAPFLFFEDQLHIATQKDEVPTLSTDLVAVANSDPWVLYSALPAATADSLDWPTDRSWDGRWIEIKDSAGVYHRHQIRTTWKYTNAPNPEEYRMSLYTPFNSTSASGMSYRIYTPHYSLPADVISVNSMRLYQENEGWPLDIMGQMEAEEKRIADANRNVSAGRPRVAYRREHWSMPAPTEDPEEKTFADTNIGGATFAWKGPEPAGTFQYVFTYCWGRRDDQHWRMNPGIEKSTLAANLDWCNPSSSSELPLYSADNSLYTELSGLADRARYSPLWESAPSEASEVITASTDGPGIYLKFPDLEKMQGFGYTTTSNGRYRKSGWRIRIYRKRLTSTAATGFTGFEEEDLEDSGVYHLMMEVPGWCSEIIDNGAITPDHATRLKSVHGYQNIALYPRPDARYELDVRCIRRPAPLIHDQDAPKIHPESVELILQRALTFLYESQGNKGMSGIAFARYERDLQTLSKRYGDLRTSARATYRKVSRANSGSRSSRNMRQWWTTST